MTLGVIWLDTRRWVRSPFPGGRATLSITYSFHIEWKALAYAVPVALLLLAFAAMYWIAARQLLVNRRLARIVITALAFIHTPAAALWVLMLFGVGLRRLTEVRTWWEQSIIVATMVVCGLAVPWLMFFTVAALDSLRQFRRRRPDPQPSV